MLSKSNIIDWLTIDYSWQYRSGACYPRAIYSAGRRTARTLPLPPPPQ